MKREIIDTLKKLKTKIDLNDLLKLQINNEHINPTVYCLESELFTKYEVLELFINLVGSNLKKNQDLATKILLNCLEDANLFICKLIFKKKLLINDDTKGILKRYINVNGIRTIICKLFIKNNMFFEDEHIYDIEKLNNIINNLENVDTNSIYNNEILFKICRTINTSEFKYTKKTLKQIPIDKLAYYLPKLKKKGIKNFEILSGNEFHKYIEVLKDKYYGSDWIEFIKKIDNFLELYNFFLTLKINDSINSIIIFMKHFKCKINELKKNSGLDNKAYIEKCGNKIKFDDLNIKKYGMTCFDHFKSCFMYNVIIPKCKSFNFHNRYLGINLFIEMYENEDIYNNKDMIKRLIFDKSNEIRDLAKIFISFVIENYSDYINKLQSDDVAMIEGAINILEYEDKNKVYNHFMEYVLNKVDAYGTCEYMMELSALKISKKILSANINEEKIKKMIKMPIYGFIKYFGHVKYIDKQLQNLIIYIHKYTIKKTKKYYWKTCKECCYYFNQIGNHERVMNTLLKTDHFGIISNIKLFVTSDNINLSKLLEKGSKKIIDKKNCIRKSGGLGVYYSILIKNKNNYTEIRNSLIRLMFVNNNTANYENIEFIKNETIVVHCLNIFNNIIECHLFDDIELYFVLVFKALLCDSFNIKNCGCTIYCMLLQKITTRYKNINIFLNIHANCRNLIFRFLEKGLSNINKDVVYFILFLYSDLNLLTKDEIEKIEEAKKFKELILLKANHILKKL